MLADRDKVSILIPQEPPMVMVHRLHEHDDRHTITSFTVEPTNIFVVNGVLSEAGLIENMAQTAALRTGWIAAGRIDGNKYFSPPVGVIGAIKNLEIHRMPEINSQLETTVEILAEFGSATVVMAFIRHSEELLAEAELKIFLTDTGEVNAR